MSTANKEIQKFKTGQRVKVTGLHQKDGKVSDYEAKRQFIGKVGVVRRFLKSKWPRVHDAYLLSLTKDFLFAPDQLEPAE